MRWLAVVVRALWFSAILLSCSESKTRTDENLEESKQQSSHTGADTDTDSDGDTDIDADTDSDSETDSDIDSDSDTDVDSDTDSDSDTDADSDEDSDSDTSSNSDMETTDTETTTTVDPDSDTGPPATFRNPLNTVRGSDPFLRYYEGYYYLTATNWSSRLTMKRAATIEGLKTAEEVVIWEEGNMLSNRCCNMWAPEFYLIDGKWYYYYTAGRYGSNFDYQRMYVLESEGTDPMGRYTWKGQVFAIGDSWAIDGSILELEGDRYFMFSHWLDNQKQCLYIARMSNPWTITGSATRISCPQYSWEKHDSNVNEGPEAMQRDGRTFVVYSASGCMGIEYKLGLLELVKGGNPMQADDWIKYPEPVFKWREERGRGVYGPGHNGIFKSPDDKEWWHVYHANSNRNGTCDTNRTTRAQKINWNEDGTPDFGQPKFLNEDIVVPSGE